ncbi:MAG: hypothetical protein PF513_05735 [Tenericutes bacterium]|jgi:hypothetical protein|nr:hypothetical protein [Mycoplasmatota bacterium]
MLPIDLLEGFEKKMSAFQKRPACNVDIATLPEAYDDITSLYIRDKHHIVFNDKYYQEATELEIMGALFHEIRHAYQHFIIETEDISQEPIEVINQWKIDFDEYIQPINKDKLQPTVHEEDYLTKGRLNAQNNLIHNIGKSQDKTFDYLTSNIEVDALAYADLNIFHIYKIHLAIPIEMKELVLKRQEQIKDRVDIIKI